MGITDVATEAHGEGTGLVFHPLDQFKVTPLFGDGPVHWYTITNATLWMAFAVLAIVAMFVIGSRGRAIVPSRGQSIAELFYGFVYKMVEDITGHDGVKYFPYIFSLFCFIFFANFLGLLPLSFSPTSHIAVTAVLALLVFVGVTVLGFVKNGTHFLGLFAPSGVPKALLFLLIPIEVISFLSRPISLSIRLFANMVAGHVMLKVFATFVVLIGSFGALGFLGALLPMAVNVALIGFEVLVAFLQAYVFAILTSIYLHDAVHLH